MILFGVFFKVRRKLDSAAGNFYPVADRARRQTVQNRQETFNRRADFYVGVLLTGGAQINSIFLMFASVFVIISFIVLSLGIESKRKSLEEIDASFKVKTT